MREEPHTFPTLRSWQRMSESQQDAMLDRVEARRRWRAIRQRVAIAALIAVVVVAALVIAF